MQRMLQLVLRDAKTNAGQSIFGLTRADKLNRTVTRPEVAVKSCRLSSLPLCGIWQPVGRQDECRSVKDLEGSDFHPAEVVLSKYSPDKNPSVKADCLSAKVLDDHPSIRIYCVAESYASDFRIPSSSSGGTQ
jgi:hypothetical protein